MNKRTDEEKVCRAPLTVVFGGTEYEVKILVIRESREWRAEIKTLLAELPKYAKVTTDKPEEFADALQVLLIDMPDQVVDLFFKYAKELNRDEIEGIATDAEMAEAFSEVVKVAFPLAMSAVGVMEELGEKRQA